MEHSVSVTVDHPSESVWKLIGNPVQWTSWAQDLEDVDAPDVLSVGTPLSYKWRGKPTQATIACYIVNERIGIQSDQGSYQFFESLTLKEQDDQTVITFRMGFRPNKLWMKVAALLIWPLKWLLIGMPLKKGLRSLQRAIDESVA